MVRIIFSIPPPCNEDAMIYASVSMAGNVGQGIGTTIPRIDEARRALSQALPSATKFRRNCKVSLINEMRSIK